MIGALDSDEQELVGTYRESLQNDKLLLCLLLAAWAKLTPGQRQGVARIVDLFMNANSWRRSTTEGGAR